MQILIFSDTHLTKKFDRKKFELLYKIISEADQVIINGDFWDSYYIKLEEFLNSKWNKLFPLLKSKNSIYIYGNHDDDDDNDDRVLEFCDEVKERHEFKWGKKKIVVEHGDRLNASKVQRYRWISSNKVLFAFLREMSHLVYGFISQRFLGGLLSKRDHKKLKKAVLDQKKKNEIYITGHSHINELDLENGFANSGFIQHGIASYIIVSEDEIELIKRKY